MSKTIQIEDSSSNVYVIAPSQKWTFVGSSSGSGIVSLSGMDSYLGGSGWTELLVISDYIHWFFPRTALSSAFYSLYKSILGQDKSYITCSSVQISNSEVTNSYIKEYSNGTDKTFSSVFYVYVR